MLSHRFSFIWVQHVVIALAASLAIYTITELLNTPWLGGGFKTNPTDNSLLITNINAESPLSGKLESGDSILGFINGNDTPIPAIGHWITGQPELYDNHAANSSYLNYQQQLYRLVQQPEVTVITPEQRIVVKPLATRPIAQLPPCFWLILCCASSTILLGLKAFRKLPGMASGFFLIACVSSFISMIIVATFSSRELALHGPASQLLVSFKFPSTLAYHLALISLFLIYPQRLVKPLWLVMPWAVGIIIYLQQHKIWLTLSSETSYHTLPLTATALLLLCSQWAKCRDKPVDIMTVKLFLAAILMSLMISLSFDVLALQTSDHPSQIPAPVYLAKFLLLLLIHFFIFIGVTKYKFTSWGVALQDTWVIQLALALALLVDVAMIYKLNLSPTIALVFTLVTVGWLYYPLHNLLRKKIGGETQSINEHIEHIHGALSKDRNNTTGYWQQLLFDIFEPQEIKAIAKPSKLVVISDNGESLQVPSPDGSTILLRLRSKGTQVFSNKDITLANQVNNIALSLVNNRAANEAAAETERRRIMRDLHDDVAGRLLSIIHRADKENADIARSTLKELRSIIYCLDNNQINLLEQELSVWINETAERLNDIGIEFTQELCLLPAKLTINGRERLNLVRAIRETVSNIIKHSNSSRAHLQTRLTNDAIAIIINDNGTGLSKDFATTGRGVANINTRMEELEGTAQWQTGETSHFDQGSSVTLTFKLAALSLLTSTTLQASKLHHKTQRPI